MIMLTIPMEWMICVPLDFKKKDTISLYADASAARDLRRKFPYIFERQKVFADRPILGGGIPMIDLIEIDAGPHLIGKESFEFFSLPHGHEDTLGFRHQKMAYIIDCQEIPEAVLRTLHDAKLEVLIIDCLKFQPHQTHLHFDLSLKYIQTIAPKQPF
jgi:phosphoribosyl 1,2-cyclic phosphate phosphodiesterase